VIAFEYQPRFHSTVQVLAAGEDPEYGALQPWQALNLVSLQALFRGGCADEYNIGPAVRHDRVWWATSNQQTVRLKLYRPNLYTRFLAQLGGGTVRRFGSVRSLIDSVE
jgi:hypothetical protein